MSMIYTVDQMRILGIETSADETSAAVVDSAARGEFWQTFSSNRYPHFSCSETKGRGWTSFGLHTGPLKRVTALRSSSAQEMFHPRPIRESSTAYREYLPSNLASIPCADTEL
jgi:hypothetical protein